MKPIGDFSVDDKPAPTLKFIETPSANCKQALIEKRKRANMTEIKDLEVKELPFNKT